MSAEIVTNRRAYHHFLISDRIEAGIVLTGTEIKSIRAGLVNLNTAFAQVQDQEIFLMEADIQPYAQASHEQHEAKRPRKLLLHRKEIENLREISIVKGNALVALRLYWKNHRVKVEIGVGLGKTHGDKRQELKKRAVQRETDRAIASFNRR